MPDHLGVFGGCCQGGTAPRTPAPPERHAPDRVLAAIHIALDVTVDLEARSISGVVRHRVQIVPPEVSAFVIDAVALVIDAVSADGRPVPHHHDGVRLTVRPPAPWQRGEVHEIEVRYHGRPERGLYFIAPDEAYPDKPLQAWTQGQDEDGRFWFPCIDHPGQKSTTELRVRVPAGFEAVSNGHLAGRRQDGAWTEFHFIQDVPHVTYLVSLVVGRFDAVTDAAGRTPLRYLVPQGTASLAPLAFGRTPRMIALFERLFGHPYPFSKYDQVVVSDFIFGGMENTSATVLYEYVMLDETVANAVDRDDLISHELAHQWFGDLITCRDWSHAWLNEGFATYAEVLWFEHGVSPDRGAYHLLDAARLYFEEARDEYRRAIVTRAYESPVDIFDRHLYQKGACVLQHLRLELGDDAFFRGLKRYVAANARGSVETHDLRRAFESETGKNLELFFEQWIFRAGHPEIEVTHDVDPTTLRLTLHVRQTQDGARERPWRLRLSCRAWFAADAAPPADRTFEITEAEHDFTWTLPAIPEAVSVGRGGVPLARITFRRPDAWLAFQLVHDELIGRIDAAVQLGKAGTLAGVASLAQAFRTEPTWMGQVEIARALGHARGDAARDALMAGLSNDDPRTRTAVATSLGRFRNDPLAANAIESALSSERAPLVRAALYRALGGLRCPAAIPVLQAGLWEPSWNHVIGRGALDGLGALRDPGMLPLLLTSIRRGEHELRRVAGLDAIAETAKVIESKTRVREEVEPLLDDPALRVAQTAVRTLRTLGDAGAIPALERVAARQFVDPRLRSLARAAVRDLLDGHARRGTAELTDRLERAETDLRKLKNRITTLETPEKTVPARSDAASGNVGKRRRIKPSKRKLKRRT